MPLTYVTTGISIHQHKALALTGVSTFARARGCFAGAATFAGVNVDAIGLRSLRDGIGAGLRLDGRCTAGNEQCGSGCGQNGPRKLANGLHVTSHIGVV